MYTQMFDISIISNPSKNADKQSSKFSPSTQPPDSPYTNPLFPSFNSREEMWGLEAEEEEKNRLRSKISKLQREQQEMQLKYKKCIEKILIEIDKNSQYNHLLSTQVNIMKGQLQQSKKDILLIDEYMKNNMSNKEQKTDVTAYDKKPMKIVIQRQYADNQVKTKYSLTRKTPIKLFGSKLNSKM